MTISGSVGEIVVCVLAMMAWVVPLLSASTPQQLAENLDEVSLSSEQVDRLTSVGLE